MRMSVAVRASLALGRHYCALLGLPDAKRLIAEYGRADVGPMILLRGAQIIHFGSLSGDQWDIVIAA
jgi:hypothetical protein